MIMPELFKNSSAPLRVNRDSSDEMAKMVLPIIDARVPMGISARTGGISGNSGKLSREMPAILVRERPHCKLTQ